MIDSCFGAQSYIASHVKICEYKHVWHVLLKALKSILKHGWSYLIYRYYAYVDMKS